MREDLGARDEMHAGSELQGEAVSNEQASTYACVKGGRWELGQCQRQGRLARAWWMIAGGEMVVLDWLGRCSGPRLGRAVGGFGGWVGVVIGCRMCHTGQDG